MNRTKRGIDKCPNIIGILNCPLSVTDRSSRQIISTDIDDLNSSINQLDLIDIYRTLYPTTTENILKVRTCSGPQNTLQKQI